MYGIMGQNAFRGTNTNYQIPFSTSGYEPNNGRWNHQKDANNNDTPLGRNKAFTSAFWGGLPVKLSLWDPLNIEFEFNYGWMESRGRGWMSKADGTQ